MKTVVVVGGSVAGIEAARSLRRAGFDGRLTVVAAEQHEPYERPPLSKEYLAGAIPAAELALGASLDDYELVPGRTAVALRAHERAVELDDSTCLVADGIVLATGASARTLPGPASPRGVHTLRLRDDADRLRADLVPGSPAAQGGGHSTLTSPGADPIPLSTSRATDHVVPPTTLEPFSRRFP